MLRSIRHSYSFRLCLISIALILAGAWIAFLADSLQRYHQISTLNKGK